MFELDEEARWILGLPNFRCSSIAVFLRMLGHSIPEKAEEEQAAVIYWMLTLHEIHGEGWRDAAGAYLEGAKALLKPTDGEG